ncbi:Zn-dependent exopeptidase [Flagelloscypha sp. PMI_526]|nr:Zn-dependent exopeptidase [Flagelloscypha sp. PMI_526]
MKMFLASLVVVAVVGLGQAYDLQVPVGNSFPQKFSGLDYATYESQAISLATYDLTQKRLIHVFGEDQPRIATEEEKLKLLDSHHAFLDITEHPEFTSRSVLPKVFTARQASSSFSSSENLLVKSAGDDMDGIAENLKADAIKLTSFWTRSAYSQWGLYSSNWIYSHLSELIDAYPSDKVKYSIKKVPHSIPQNSIIVRLESTESTIPSEDRDILIVGAHQDSLNYKYPFYRAPGANDDGSGTIVNMQLLRSLLQHSFIPPANVAIELHWYAGEEGGNIGSVDISESYLSRSKPVKAMLQMDGIMTVPVDKEPLIAIIDTNSNMNLTAFAAKLVEKYNTVGWAYTNCGNRCGSDHISWNRTGFPAMFVYDREFVFPIGSDVYFHTSQDTIDQPGFNYTHGVEFVKFGLAWITELALSDF